MAKKIGKGRIGEMKKKCNLIQNYRGGGVVVVVVELRTKQRKEGEKKKNLHFKILKESKNAKCLHLTHRTNRPVIFTN